MRRGLMEWNAEELPIAVLEARIARVRAAMADAKLDGFILYNNIVRPSAIAWVTGFTPYWSEGLLLVPKTGKLIFATALSNRVADWIRSNNPMSEVMSSPKPGNLLGERLEKDGSVKRVGVLEFDTLPSELADHLAAAAPAVEFVDGSALFAGLRRTIDDSERELLRRTDALAVAALAQPEAASDAGTLSGLIEKHARLDGAEEAFIHIAPDLVADRRLNRTSQRVPLAERYAVRASVAYKGCWVRRTRTFARDAVKADGWLDGLTFEAGASLTSQLGSHVKKLPGAELKDWSAESCIGSYPLTVVASSRAGINFAPVAGGFFVLTVELLVDGAPWIGAKPVFVK